MNAVQVDPDQVIAKMARQVGQLSAELAMNQAALEAAQARVTELEQAAAEDGDAP